MKLYILGIILAVVSITAGIAILVHYFNAVTVLKGLGTALVLSVLIYIVMWLIGRYPN